MRRRFVVAISVEHRPHFGGHGQIEGRLFVLTTRLGVVRPAPPRGRVVGPA